MAYVNKPTTTIRLILEYLWMAKTDPTYVLTLQTKKFVTRLPQIWTTYPNS